MTGLDHERSVAVELAARWIHETGLRGRQVITQIRQRFGLNSGECVEALSLVRRLERGASI